MCILTKSLWPLRERLSARLIRNIYDEIWTGRLEALLTIGEGQRLLTLRNADSWRRELHWRFDRRPTKVQKWTDVIYSETILRIANINLARVGNLLSRIRAVAWLLRNHSSETEGQAAGASDQIVTVKADEKKIERLG